MTVSPPDALHNNGSPAAPLAAFRAFLQDQRPALTAALACELAQHAPHYRAMSDEQWMQRIGETIDAYLAGLDDPEELDRLSEQQLGPRLTMDIDLDSALQLTSIYRRQFVDLAVRALAAHVNGAAEGLQALMELVDRRARALTQFYQERLRLFETLVENSPDGIGVSSLDGKQLYPNPAFRALLGYGDDLVGVHFDEYLEDSDPAIMQQLMERGFWQGINTYRRKDGSTLRGHSTIFVIPDAKGQPYALGGVVRDISEQLRCVLSLRWPRTPPTDSSSPISWGR
jgi:PAS domain S-box-containing protein